jgi:hypothetical protein
MAIPTLPRATVLASDYCFWLKKTVLQLGIIAKISSFLNSILFTENICRNVATNCNGGTASVLQILDSGDSIDWFGQQPCQHYFVAS